MASEQEVAGIGQCELLKHQLRFITYSGERNARWGGDWCYMESARAGVHYQPENSLSNPAAPSNLLCAVMHIIQAPACFSRPVTQKKPFRPPFKIRLDLKHTGKLQLPVKVEAVALPEQSVDHLMQHNQSGGLVIPAQLPQQIELENASISSCLQTHDDENKSGERCYSEDLEFTDLRFSKSSRMNRRWIMFTCKLGWDMLYALYKLPTIVLSRKTDQYDKACVILLQKGLPNCGTQACRDFFASKSIHSNTHKVVQELKSTQPQLRGIMDDGSPVTHIQRNQSHEQQFVTQAHVWQYIETRYAESGLDRGLTTEDIVSLEAKSGLRSIPGTGSNGLVTDWASWTEFTSWFEACLRSLKRVDHLWSANDITRICTFTVDRNFSESALKDEQHGTFLVRLCSEPGAFAISVKVHLEGFTPEIKHVLIDALDLKEQSLERWVAATRCAENLLDIKNGFHVPKAYAFREHGPVIVGSPPEVDHRLCQPGALLTSSPQQSSHNSLDQGTPAVSLEAPFSEDALPRDASTASVQTSGVSQAQAGTPQAAHFTCASQGIFSKKLQCLMADSGLTLQDLQLLQGGGLPRDVVLRKRSLSSASVDTTVSMVNERRKRRIVTTPHRVFGEDAQLLLTIPPCAISQSVDSIKCINGLNI